MAVRDQQGGPAHPVAADPDRQVVTLAEAPVHTPRLAWRYGFALLILVAVVGAGVWWMATEGHQVEARPAAEPPGAAAPAGLPSGLAVTVHPPATVVAGRPARFVVRYTDGEGIFSGGVEDWGDTGVGSVRMAACGASPPSAAPLSASYVATHKWSTAGSYPVSFTVTTYTCRDGRAREEMRSVRLAVVVAAR